MYRQFQNSSILAMNFEEAYQNRPNVQASFGPYSHLYKYRHMHSGLVSVKPLFVQSGTQSHESKLKAEQAL